MKFLLLAIFCMIQGITSHTAIEMKDYYTLAAKEGWNMENTCANQYKALCNGNNLFEQSVKGCKFETGTCFKNPQNQAVNCSIKRSECEKTLIESTTSLERSKATTKIFITPSTKKLTSTIRPKTRIMEFPTIETTKLSSKSSLTTITSNEVQETTSYQGSKELPESSTAFSKITTIESSTKRNTEMTSTVPSKGETLSTPFSTIKTMFEIESSQQSMTPSITSSLPTSVVSSTIHKKSSTLTTQDIDDKITKEKTATLTTQNPKLDTSNNFKSSAMPLTKVFTSIETVTPASSTTLKILTPESDETKKGDVSTMKAMSTEKATIGDLTTSEGLTTSLAPLQTLNTDNEGTIKAKTEMAPEKATTFGSLTSESMAEIPSTTFSPVVSFSFDSTITPSKDNKKEMTSTAQKVSASSSPAIQTSSSMRTSSEENLSSLSPSGMPAAGLVHESSAVTTSSPSSLEKVTTFVSEISKAEEEMTTPKSITMSSKILVEMPQTSKNAIAKTSETLNIRSDKPTQPISYKNSSSFSTFAFNSPKTVAAFDEALTITTPKVRTTASEFSTSIKDSTYSMETFSNNAIKSTRLLLPNSDHGTEPSEISSVATKQSTTNTFEGETKNDIRSSTKKVKFETKEASKSPHETDALVTTLITPDGSSEETAIMRSSTKASKSLKTTAASATLTPLQSTQASNSATSINNPASEKSKVITSTENLPSSQNINYASTLLASEQTSQLYLSKLISSTEQQSSKNLDNFEATTNLSGQSYSSSPNILPSLNSTQLQTNSNSKGSSNSKTPIASSITEAMDLIDKTIPTTNQVIMQSKESDATLENTVHASVGSSTNSFALLSSKDVNNLQVTSSLPFSTTKSYAGITAATLSDNERTFKSSVMPKDIKTTHKYTHQSSIGSSTTNAFKSLVSQTFPSSDKFISVTSPQISSSRVTMESTVDKPSKFATSTQNKNFRTTINTPLTKPNTYYSPTDLVRTSSTTPELSQGSMSTFTPYPSVTNSKTIVTILEKASSESATKPVNIDDSFESDIPSIKSSTLVSSMFFKAIEPVSATQSGSSSITAVSDFSSMGEVTNSKSNTIQFKTDSVDTTEDQQTTKSNSFSLQSSTPSNTFKSSQGQSSSSRTASSISLTSEAISKKAAGIELTTSNLDMASTNFVTVHQTTLSPPTSTNIVSKSPSQSTTEKTITKESSSLAQSTITASIFKTTGTNSFLQEITSNTDAPLTKIITYSNPTRASSTEAKTNPMSKTNFDALGSSESNFQGTTRNMAVTKDKNKNVKPTIEKLLTEGSTLSSIHDLTSLNFKNLKASTPNSESLPATSSTSLETVTANSAEIEQTTKPPGMASSNIKNIAMTNLPTILTSNKPFNPSSKSTIMDATINYESSASSPVSSTFKTTTGRQLDVGDETSSNSLKSSSKTGSQSSMEPTTLGSEISSKIAGTKFTQRKTPEESIKLSNELASSMSSMKTTIIEQTETSVTINQSEGTQSTDKTDTTKVFRTNSKQDAFSEGAPIKTTEENKAAKTNSQKLLTTINLKLVSTEDPKISEAASSVPTNSQATNMALIKTPKYIEILSFTPMTTTLSDKKLSSTKIGTTLEDIIFTPTKVTLKLPSQSSDSTSTKILDSSLMASSKISGSISTPLTTTLSNKKVTTATKTGKPYEEKTATPMFSSLASTFASSKNSDTTLRSTISDANQITTIKSDPTAHKEKIITTPLNEVSSLAYNTDSTKDISPSSNNTSSTSSLAPSISCEQSCPSDFFEGSQACFKWMDAPITAGYTYFDLENLCMSIREDAVIVSLTDFQTPQNMDLFKKLRANSKYNNSDVLTNAVLTQKYFTDHYIQMVDLEESRFDNISVSEIPDTDKAAAFSSICRISQNCKEHYNCDLNQWMSASSAQFYAVINGTTTLVETGTTITVYCTAVQPYKKININCDRKGYFIPDSSMTICGKDEEALAMNTTLSITPMPSSTTAMPENIHIKSCMECSENTVSCGGNENGTLKCICDKSFTGTTCSHFIDPCTNYGCLNGGKTINHFDSCDCQCSSDFFGENCEKILYNSTEAAMHLYPEKGFTLTQVIGYLFNMQWPTFSTLDYSDILPTELCKDKIGFAIFWANIFKFFGAVPQSAALKDMRICQLYFCASAVFYFYSLTTMAAESLISFGIVTGRFSNLFKGNKLNRKNSISSNKFTFLICIFTAMPVCILWIYSSTMISTRSCMGSLNFGNPPYELNTQALVYTFLISLYTAFACVFGILSRLMLNNPIFEARRRQQAGQFGPYGNGRQLYPVEFSVYCLFPVLRPLFFTASWMGAIYSCETLTFYATAISALLSGIYGIISLIVGQTGTAEVMKTTIKRLMTWPPRFLGFTGRLISPNFNHITLQTREEILRIAKPEWYKDIMEERAKNNQGPPVHWPIEFDQHIERDGPTNEPKFNIWHLKYEVNEWNYHQSLLKTTIPLEVQKYFKAKWTAEYMNHRATGLRRWESVKNVLLEVYQTRLSNQEIPRQKYMALFRNWFKNMVHLDRLGIAQADQDIFRRGVAMLCQEITPQIATINLPNNDSNNWLSLPLAKADPLLTEANQQKIYDFLDLVCNNITSADIFEEENQVSQKNDNNPEAKYAVGENIDLEANLSGVNRGTNSAPQNLHPNNLMFNVAYNREFQNNVFNILKENLGIDYNAKAAKLFPLQAFLLDETRPNFIGPRTFANIIPPGISILQYTAFYWNNINIEIWAPLRYNAFIDTLITKGNKEEWERYLSQILP